jgi:hypothetical protein
MTSEENSLISGLFDRLGSADTHTHDAEAEKLIRQSVASHPAAPYLLVQTVLVQEHALMNAQARIKALEQQVAASAQPAPAAHSGGFLSGLFGGGSGTPAPTNIPARTLPPAPAPSYPSTVSMPASAGGGFLRSALTTAAGVAGGAMLFEGIEDLLGHRSGAFGSGLGGGGGGFMDTGFGGRPETMETVNNYYGSDAGGSPGSNAGTQNSGDFQDTGFTAPSDDFPASPDLGSDAPVPDATDDFGGSNDSFADSGSSDFSSDDSSQT